MPVQKVDRFKAASCCANCRASLSMRSATPELAADHGFVVLMLDPFVERVEVSVVKNGKIARLGQSLQ